MTSWSSTFNQIIENWFILASFKVMWRRVAQCNYWKVNFIQMVYYRVFRKCGKNQLLQQCTARTACSDSVIRSASVIKLVSVLFSKCTTLVVTKCWPMETRLPYGDQWKAEKLGAFWRWPITRCFIKSDRAGLIIDHSIIFRLNGEHWRAVQWKECSSASTRHYQGEYKDKFLRSF